MKKGLVLLLVLTLVMNLFAGGSTETAKNDNGKKEIVVWHTWGQDAGFDALQKVVDTYNETNDKNIHVNLTFVANQASGNTSTMANLMAAIAAGNPPDIALLDNFQVATWAAQNAIQPIDEFMSKADFSLDGVYDWATAGSIYKGQTYSVPYNGDARALVYNKKMFREAGLDPENPPTTIEGVTEAAKKLTIREGSFYKQAGFVPWKFAGLPLYTWGWSFGGDFYDAENNVLTVATPETIAALQWEVDFAKAMGGEAFVNFASGLGTGAEDPFVTEQLAMCIRGQWDLANFERYNPNLEYGVAPIPSLVEGENITWCGGWGWTIPRGAKNTEEAMDFLKYTISEEAQTIMASVSGSLSPVKSVSEAVFADQPKFKVFIESLNHAFVRPPVPVGQMLWDDLNTVVDSALHGKGNPEQLLKDEDAKINAELKKFN